MNIINVLHFCYILSVIIIEYFVKFAYWSNSCLTAVQLKLACTFLQHYKILLSGNKEESILNNLYHQGDSNTTEKAII